MTTNDHKLLQQAQSCSDFQEVVQLMEQAESQEARTQLKQRSRRLHCQEEVFARCH